MNTGFRALSIQPRSLFQEEHHEIQNNYGGKTAYDPKDFSRGKFECKAVFQTRKGMPVVVSHSTDPDYDYWKVEYDFACVVFAEYQDALDFCAGRFFDPDGKPVKAVRA